MPVAVSYPGVYIEEIPSGVRTITGVATSITAFVGYTRKGEPDKAVPISSFADFERLYGRLDRASPVSYAVNQFYANGGTQALIVRVAAGTVTARWELKDAANTLLLDVEASSPGTFGNDLRLSVATTTNSDSNFNVSNPDGNFNLLVFPTKAAAQAIPPQPVEIHRNLNLNPNSSSYVESVVNNASSLIRVTRKIDPSAFTQNGFALSKKIDFSLLPTASDLIIAGVIDGSTPFQIDLGPPMAANIPTTIGAMVDAVHAALVAGGWDAKLAVSDSGSGGAAGTGWLMLKSKAFGLPTMESSSVVISGGVPSSLVAKIGMGLANGGREFPGDAQHRPAAATSVEPATKGDDGSKGGSGDLIGDEANKKGIYALLDVDLFNILVIPETFDLGGTEAVSVIQKGIELCERPLQRAFSIVDPPSSINRSNIASWAKGVSSSSYAAVYFPAIKIADPLDQFRPRAMAASGTIAGIYARTDAQRGVWKAPAGTDATLNGVDSVVTVLNDIENGQINQKGINALRVFRDYGKVVWGARTMAGDDSNPNDYKFVPIRRLALFLEQSLYRGTQWVVFEPNDEPLWAQIRLNIGAFMQNLFRQGAFQGKTPQEAYFVKCDKETTTQNDINLGIVNIVVGFAPLKPAEFVVIQIQQIAGPIAT